MKSLYIDSGTLLTRMKMESSVREKVAQKGLKPSKTPPIKIKVMSKTLRKGEEIKTIRMIDDPHNIECRIGKN